MANYKTGAQRYNDRMDKIWEEARKHGALSDKSPAKSKALKMKMGDKRTKKERYENLLRIGKEGAEHFQRD